MALWDDLKADVITWTNRPELVVETELALKSAIRQAHKQGRFWRDLTKVTLVGLDVSTAVQSIDLELQLPRFKQISYVKIPNTETYYEAADIDTLLDLDGYSRTNIYWGFGAVLNVRGEAPQDSLEIGYFQQPIVAPPEEIGDWLLTNYKDFVVLLAAGTVLGIIGEQEIKQRVDGLTILEASRLKQDQLEVQAR